MNYIRRDASWVDVKRETSVRARPHAGICMVVGCHRHETQHERMYQGAPDEPLKANVAIDEVKSTPLLAIRTSTWEPVGIATDKHSTTVSDIQDPETTVEPNMQES